MVLVSQVESAGILYTDSFYSDVLDQPNGHQHRLDASNDHRNTGSNSSKMSQNDTWYDNAGQEECNLFSMITTYFFTN
jgi:hypothetical protein